MVIKVLPIIILLLANTGCLVVEEGVSQRLAVIGRCRDSTRQLASSIARANTVSLMAFMIRVVLLTGVHANPLATLAIGTIASMTR